VNLSMDTLPNRRYFITGSTVQGLSLNNNEREKAVNRYFAFTAKGDAVQSPVSFKIRA
jgi:hypothetical protein